VGGGDPGDARGAPLPAGRTNRSRWNSVDQAVLELPIFAELRDAARQRMYAFAEVGADAPAFTLQSWVNIHERGGFNFQHMHEGALVSGTFYLQVPGRGRWCSRIRVPVC